MNRSNSPRANTNATRSALSLGVGILGLAAFTFAGCVVRGGGYDDDEPYLDTYDACASSSECFDSECWLITVEYSDGYVTDSMCTYECNSDNDCDYGGYCLAVSDEPPLCYEPCFDDYDCDYGFACVADEFGFDPVCLPW